MGKSLIASRGNRTADNPRGYSPLRFRAAAGSRAYCQWLESKRMGKKSRGVVLPYSEYETCRGGYF